MNELKIPLVDERVYDKADVISKNTIAKVTFRFEEDESVIRGFLGLAEYFHTIIVKSDDKFYIPHSSILFKLESD